MSRRIVTSTVRITPTANSNGGASNTRQPEIPMASPISARLPTSLSGTNLNVAMTSAAIRRPSDTASPQGSAAYRATLVSHFAEDLERRRRAERAAEDARNEMIPSDVLKIDTVEFYARDNAREHRTDRYELVRDTPASTILRRGQQFFMALRFKDRAYDARRDILRVSFNFGPSPQVTKGTKVVLPFKPTQREFSRGNQKWDLRMHQLDGMIVTLQINIPASALVGLWRCVIETTTSTPGSRLEEHRCKDDIYVLFNPFCKDDAVYLESEEHRKEYVMNETGKVWVGTHQRPKGRRWVYGQFNDVSLPAALLLLEMSGINPVDRGNPVMVVRAISAVVNSNDEDGLLEGRWEGPYDDGVSPWTWTGTSKILEQFLRQGCKPVKYGQCWVFAAAATSICRALGIPARPVTNFVSAHDTNHSLSVDKYFDIFGEEIKGGPHGDCNDSIWNFHVWTEVWTSRPDLPHGYGGWQAIDATPQEFSGGKMQCGPASIEAIRRGEVGFGYDTSFVFSEVNADVCHFQEDENSDWGFKKVKVNTYHVGRQIITKRAGIDDEVGDADAEDITDHYKNPEANKALTSSYSDKPMLYPGSAAERVAVMNAVRGVERAHQAYEFPSKINEDVFFDLVELERIPFGQPFNVTVHIVNRSQEMRTISAILSASSVYYTGVTARRLAKSDRQLILQPGQRETLQIRVTWEDYHDKLVEYGMVKLYSIATVQETKQTWSEEDDFQLEKPKLELQVRGNPQVNQDCFVTFSFMNPLPVNLTECEFIFEGPGLARPQNIKFKDVKMGEMVSHTQKFTPRQSGERKLVATFNSRELNDITGSRTVHVRD